MVSHEHESLSILIKDLIQNLQNKGEYRLSDSLSDRLSHMDAYYRVYIKYLDKQKECSDELAILWSEYSNCISISESQQLLNKIDGKKEELNCIKEYVGTVTRLCFEFFFGLDES